jgi:hypothetical protein
LGEHPSIDVHGFDNAHTMALYFREKGEVHRLDTMNLLWMGSLWRCGSVPFL